MHKHLSDEQRMRLEKIAEDEFGIKYRELSAKKGEAFTKWLKDASAKVDKDPMVKKYREALATCNKLNARLYQRGIAMSHQGGNKVVAELVQNNLYRAKNSKPYPGLEAQQQKQKMDMDSFNRAKNEVLSAIWSMEKPFSECMALIRNKVAKIK